MKKILLFFILFTTKSITYTQINHVKKIELELNNGYTNEEITQFGAFGFILSSKNDQVKNNHISEWKYDLYNTDLQLIKSETVLLEKKIRVDETCANIEGLHTLFRSKSNKYTLVSVSSATLEVTKIELDLPNKTIVTEMTVLGDITFFKAKVKKNNYLFSVNWKTGENKLIPINIPNYKNKQTKLSEFQVIEEYNELILYIKVIINKKHSDIFVLHLNDKGEKLGLFNLSKDIQENVTNVSTSKIGDNNYIITGTYSTELINSSEGIFIAEIDNNKLKFFKKTNFLDLENFLSYLPQKKEEKINKKKERKKKKGKEFKINYRIASHEILELEDGYLFLGEAYYPTYRREAYTTTSYINGVPTTTTSYRTVFDGYQYTHAILAKFNFEGNLIWDEIFDMWPSYKPYFEKKFISISNRDKTSIKLVFSSYSLINSKSFDYEGNTLLDNQYDIIEKKHEDDKHKNTFSNIEYWYENYFIAFGKQKIKNKSGDIKKKRKVYFINKINFE